MIEKDVRGMNLKEIGNILIENGLKKLNADKYIHGDDEDESDLNVYIAVHWAHSAEPHTMYIDIDEDNIELYDRILTNISVAIDVGMKKQSTLEKWR